MKTKLTLAVLLPLLVFGTAMADAKQPNKTTTGTTANQGEPAKKERSSLPAGWFEKGKADLILPGDKQDSIHPAAHFDTPGQQKTSRRTVAQRLKSAKNAVIYSELPNPMPSVEVDSHATPLKLDNAEFSLQAPIATPQDVTSQISNAPMKSIVVERSTSADLHETPRLALNPGATSPSVLAETETLSSVGVEPDAEEAMVGDSEPVSLFSAPPTISVESTDDFAASDASDARTTTSDAFSSVVTKSSIRHQTSDESETTVERMQLSPIDENVEVLGGAPKLAAQPMAHEFSTDSKPTESPSNDADVLISNQSPVILVQTRGPRTIVVGKPATYTFVVRNASDNNAKDVVVNLNIPTWTQVQGQDASVGSARLTPDDRGNTVMRWAVGQLAAQGKETLKLQIVPKSSRPFDLGVTWSFNPARTRTQIQVQEPKLDVAVVGPADVLFGEKKIYTLTVSNPGTGDAEGVVVQLLPFIPSEDPAVRELGTLKAGARRTLEVELKARQTGRLHVRAEATGANGLRAAGQQEVFVRRAAVQVTAEAPEMKYAGSTANYRVRIANEGDAMARDVVAVATLPNGAADIRAKANGDINDTRSEIHWELGSLRPGAVRVLEFSCILTNAGENRVDVRSVAADNLSAVASARTTVESLADLKLTVNDPKGAIATGSEVVYEVRVTNRGTKDAKNISMVGYFSEGIEPSSIGGWTGKVHEGQVEMDHINRLGPGQELTIKITAIANRPGNHVFRAELTCNNPETRLASEEWTRFYGDGVQVLNASRDETTRR